MQDAEESLVETTGVVARGEADVTWPGSGAERVRCYIEPAPLEVEADRRRCGLAEHLLPVHRVLALQDFAAWLPRRAQHGPDERYQFRAQGGEHPCDLGRRRARLELIE